MYLHLEESVNTALDLVLSTQEDNGSKEWPAKWGMFEEKVVDDESQQWFYNETAQTLTNAASPNHTLDVYEGWLYLADINNASPLKRPEYPTEARKWFYEDGIQALTTMVKGIKN